MTAQRRPLGRHLQPNHDPRSRAFPARTAPLRTVRHDHQGLVLDQGDLGACVGYAATQALNTRPLLGPGRTLMDSRQADGLYALSTSLDPWPGTWPGEDTGSSGLAVAKAARKCGYIAAYRHAFGVQHTLGALVTAPLIIGIGWREGMFEPTAEGLLEPTGEVAGGHEVALIGLSAEDQTVTVLNSWGPDWGDQGTARMRWSVLSRLLGEGGDATVLEPLAT